MQISIQRRAEVLTFKQLLMATLAFLVVFIWVFHFNFGPKIVRTLIGKDAAASYQSHYYSNITNSNHQNSIAYKFYTGELLYKSNKQATDWWKRAADQGNEKAQANLARAYLLGEGVRKNYELANRLIAKSMSQNY